MLDNLSLIDINQIIPIFKEEEGNKIIIREEVADRLQLSYTFTAAWITLTVHSSPEAIGLTSAFSTALSEAGISCNVVAAFYHDHIFVDQKGREKTIGILDTLSG